MIMPWITSVSKVVQKVIIIGVITVLVGGAPGQLLVSADTVTPIAPANTTGTQPASNDPGPSGTPSPDTTTPPPTPAPTTPDPSTTTTPAATPTTTSPPAPTDTTSTPTSPSPTSTPATNPVTATPSTSTSTTQGPTSPPGPANPTYTFNPATGLWENQYYTWNPATGQTTPKTPVNYSYNPATGQWDTTQWVYDPASSSYKPNVIATSTPPLAAALNLSAPLSNGNTVNLTTNTDGIFNNFYNATISNNIGSQALTGNASVLGNTLGGNATSGNALAMATILNMLQSTASLAGPNAASFVSNIYGDIQGDLVIDPTVLLQNLSGNTAVTQATNNNLTINNQSTGQINNKVNLAATSGNATVADNTTAGNATSGNAEAIANVINMLNSMITANQSFVGVVNVYGNLSGNILMPQQLISDLIASNAPSTNVNLNTDVNNNLIANTTTTTNIANNLNSTATSGQAAVSQNTTAGSATTGSAGTNVTVFNLTGNQVVGADTILVFVNVLGKWVGVLMNAPGGSTAAAYGSNLTKNATVNNNVNITNANTSNITNSITAAATSGNASVTKNTTAGNATSGNANTAINLANLTNDNFNVSSWFGVLFINIFGNWFGNFGALTPPSQSATGGTGGSNTNPTVSNTSKTTNTPHLAVFRFLPATTPSTTNTSTTIPEQPSAADLAALQTALTAHHVLGTVTKAPSTPTTAQSHSISGQTILAAILVSAGLSLAGLEQFWRLRNH